MVLPAVRAQFRAIAETVVPEASRLDEAGWADLEALVEKAVRERPPAVGRQLVLLIRAIQILPILRWGRPFTRLGASERTRFLTSLQNAPLLLLRRGFWGVRTLAYLGFYARPEAGQEIGYRADPRGWEARRGVAGRT